MMYEKVRARLAAAALRALGALQATPAAVAQAGQKPAAANPGRYPFTAADVQFVTGMISHHAQALVMARWAPTHGAGKSVSVLCERIINAQSDEIALMQAWLRDRSQPVPESKAVPIKMMMNGMEHDMLMPGMLSDDQLKQLDAARGREFDQLFLRFMIQHHRGAMTMVTQLLASPGAAQDEWIYKFQSDVYADQGTEIERMERMLINLPPA